MGRWIHPKDDSQQSILGKSGTVYAMDYFPRLVETTRTNLMKDDKDLLTNNVVKLQSGNGWKGWKNENNDITDEEIKFDVIHVGAAADKFPEQLANQLYVGGTMVIPIGPNGGTQYFYNVKRIANTGIPKKDFQMTRQLGVRYVPLIH